MTDITVDMCRPLIIVFNLNSRYYGVNDPVAEKLMRRASAMPKLESPEDKSITTLYVGNLGDRIGEKDLRLEHTNKLIFFVLGR